MDLPNQLSLQLNKKGWTLSVLARKSGVPQATLHGWSTGRSVQSLDDLKKVCTVLEIGLHELIFGSPDPFENQVINLKDLLAGEFKIIISN